MTRSVIGAMCTFERPEDLRRSLDALADGEPALDRLVIVDNGDTDSTAKIISDHRLRQEIPIDLVTPGQNLGPAGGYAEAVGAIERNANPDDLVVILDDDDPPASGSVLHDLVQLAHDAIGDDIAGVGLRGGALNLRTGIIASRPTNSVATEPADHLHGDGLPIYRLGALRDVDAFDRDLFWGFDDLEIGRRLARQGYGLLVAGELYSTVDTPRTPHLTTSLAPRSWRHYYRHRNMLRILTRDRAWSAVAVTVCLRLIAKPVINLPRNPRLALWHLRTNLTAIRDGLFRTKNSVHDAHRPEVLPT